jgi:hypothetical protein
MGTSEKFLSVLWRSVSTILNLSMKPNLVSFPIATFTLCALNQQYDLSNYECKSTYLSMNLSSTIVSFTSNFALSMSSLLNVNLVTVILTLQNLTCPFEFSMLNRVIVTCNLNWMSIVFLVIGVVSVLFFDWDVVIAIGSNCFLYSSVLVFDIMFIKLLFGKIVSPIGLIFNIYDRDILLRFS